MMRVTEMTLPIRVLVLEDHAFARAVAVNMLRQLGCQEVFEASDGAEALAVLQEVGAVDIALCDLCMDGMDGLEFFQRVGPSGLVGSIIISSSLSADLRRAVCQIVSLSGLRLLGDVGKPLQVQALIPLLHSHRAVLRDDSRTQQAPVPASEAEVRSALRDGQFQPYYQPKFNLLTGEVCGVEVLARWLHPFRGLLSPAVFMPVLERCELLDELLFSQMDQALTLQREARQQGFELNVAFNLHAMQLAHPDLVATIKGILQAHGAPGACLTFELTESGLLEAPATSLESLVRLRMMGSRLSIDDFGAGFSSLQRLCQLPFNEIKLDAEFVRTLEDEPRCRAVIGSTLALGEALGMSVVIEGIETQAQREQLLALGCVNGQGYVLARPMSGSDLLRWLQIAAVARRKNE
ncbi:EAL domain, c-di-GMP-specific phosphodiesterase class I (or its enzymatically inactive variant) [Pseudomonas sp. ok272]|uniref:EAL domain-containing response regulator n=1 Tax=unclassified Pseudomonas TaxID=196821 RepID=UPI0008C6FBC5|nr:MULTISPECIES: EAL domain-containing response regulator [unclassified Pseudomonas]SEM69678.1 EAL domain, c-di-GMP-specific phosphodiesterase class I (or its enzymatically inactive variant) [Pseudomonas sp. ok272]SFM58365.1 EAL domain, c-di-GMP-specific phosphodiesterase class I (or its enzymatically inactive variant) [Pseudomonas sp. ok602]